MHERRRPDWVMVGFPHPAGGVGLIASKELTRSELEVVVHEELSFDPNVRSWPPTTYTLSVVMKNYLLVLAPTYQEAFIKVFQAWSPDPDPRQELGGPAMIES